MVARIPPTDGAWPRLLDVLEEQANIDADDTLLKTQAQRLIAAWPQSEKRAALYLRLATRALSGEAATEARAHFESAVADAPTSDPGREAAAHLYELDNLRPGQPAPDFTATTRDGSTIRLAELRGSPVLIVFWASW